MSGGVSVWIEGAGAWAPGLPDWPVWRALLRGEGDVVDDSPARPTPGLLAPAERRRVSAHVLVALEVASQALVGSGRDGAALPCVFCSAHGDSAIMDYMCATLAQAPREMSPTRFHNSVHNAAAGYWTIASGSHAPSSAVAALQCSFGASLLEAAVQACAETRPVLLVASDMPGTGALGDMIASTRAFGAALVLSPAASPQALARLDLSLQAQAGATTTMPRHPHAAALADDNLCALGLPLFEVLATGAYTDFTLQAAPSLALRVHMEVPA